MSHHHDHTHDHDHSHGHDREMPFAEKLSRLLEHWVQHNEEHVRSYREWAGKARDDGLSDAAAQIDRAAEATTSVTELFQKALAAIPSD